MRGDAPWRVEKGEDDAALAAAAADGRKRLHAEMSALAAETAVMECDDARDENARLRQNGALLHDHLGC